MVVRSLLALIIFFFVHGDESLNNFSIERFFNSYITHHSNRTLFGERKGVLCARKFAVATWTCDNGVGNRLNEFMNTYLGGVIMNRTVLWRYCKEGHWREDSPCEGHPSYCASSMRMKAWMPEYFETRKLLSERGCPLEGVNELISMDERIHPYKKLACGLLLEGNLNSRAISFGKLEQHEMFSIMLPGARIENSSKLAVETFRRMGSFATYGALWRTAFAFNQSLLSANDARLAGYDKPFIIGAHIRHIDLHDPGIKDTGEEYCLEHIVKEHKWANPAHRDRQCIVAVASDRPYTIERLFNFSRMLGCTPMSANDFKIAEDVKYDSEHGPFADPYAKLLDIEFLSRADYLIGEHSSTFTMLIDSRAALRILLRSDETFTPSSIAERLHDHHQGCVPLYMHLGSKNEYNFSDPHFDWNREC